jgi:hypothetical protein
MFSENGMLIDIDALKDSILSADLFVLGFQGFSKRLLIDTRSNHRAEPLLTIVEPVNTANERYQWLSKHRADFRLPETFFFAVWPHSIKYLTEIKIIEVIYSKIAGQMTNPEKQFENILNELEQLEHENLVASIQGTKGWETIWP